MSKWLFIATLISIGLTFALGLIMPDSLWFRVGRRLFVISGILTVLLEIATFASVALS